jgi:hypothetical protein
MPIRVTATAGLKVPGPEEYSSRQASVSIESTIADEANLADEAARLLQLAEDQARAHLDGTRVPTAPPRSSVPPARSYQRQERGRSGSPNPSASGGRGRFTPKRASAAQVRYLRTLLGSRTQAEEEDILAEHGVGVVDDLTSKACSQVIDRLKNTPA